MSCEYLDRWRRDPHIKWDKRKDFTSQGPNNYCAGYVDTWHGRRSRSTKCFFSGVEVAAMIAERYYSPDSPHVLLRTLEKALSCTFPVPRYACQTDAAIFLFGRDLAAARYHVALPHRSIDKPLLGSPTIQLNKAPSPPSAVSASKQAHHSVSSFWSRWQSFPD